MFGTLQLILVTYSVWFENKKISYSSTHGHIYWFMFLSGMPQYYILKCKYHKPNNSTVKLYPLLRRWKQQGIHWVTKSVKAITLYLEAHNMIFFLLVQYIKYVLSFVNKMKLSKSE